MNVSTKVETPSPPPQFSIAIRAAWPPEAGIEDKGTYTGIMPSLTWEVNYVISVVMEHLVY